MLSNRNASLVEFDDLNTEFKVYTLYSYSSGLFTLEKFFLLTKKEKEKK